MHKYIAKRLLLILPTLLGAAVLVFFLLRAIPGDVCEVRLAGSGLYVDEAEIQLCREKLGLAKPLIVQFWNFITGYVKDGQLTNEKISIDLSEAIEVKELEGMQVILGIRPEDVHLSEDGLELPLLVAEPLGNETLLHMDGGQNILVAKVQIEETKGMGNIPKIKFDLDKIYLFDIETEQPIEFNKA